MGGNGDPAATSARPPVQSARSWGRASLRLVGLDSGMMIGRCTYAAMARTMSSVNAPVAVDRPISAVGWMAWTTSIRRARWPAPGPARPRPGGRSGAAPG